jgi:hypothetical protein
MRTASCYRPAPCTRSIAALLLFSRGIAPVSAPGPVASGRGLQRGEREVRVCYDAVVVLKWDERRGENER